MLQDLDYRSVWETKRPNCSFPLKPARDAVELTCQIVGYQLCDKQQKAIFDVAKTDVEKVGCILNSTVCTVLVIWMPMVQMLLQLMLLIAVSFQILTERAPGKHKTW